MSEVEKVPKHQDSSTLSTLELGTVRDLDDEILHTQGHEAEMPRSFSPIAAVGLAFSITGSWVGYASDFGENIAFGGPQNVVLGLVVGTVVQWIIILGLAEVASAFPSSGVSLEDATTHESVTLTFHVLFRANTMPSSASPVTDGRKLSHTGVDGSPFCPGGSLHRLAWCWLRHRLLG